MTHRTDILIVTVTKIESSAVLSAFETATQQRSTSVHIADRTYRDLGTLCGARIFMTRSEMGASGVGASLQSVQKGIAALSPSVVIMVGVAFGVDEKKQRIGDVLVARQLLLYDLQRIGTSGEGKSRIVPRGDRPHASGRLISHFQNAELDWHVAPIHFGLVLTGEKLIDNIDFREQLQTLEFEAIGGEMEGSGLYVACQDAKVDWILVKAICDWADGNKADDKAAKQQKAAGNAVSFIVHALKQTPLITARIDSQSSDRAETGISDRDDIMSNLKNAVAQRQPVAQRLFRSYVADFSKRLSDQAINISDSAMLDEVIFVSFQRMMSLRIEFIELISWIFKCEGTISSYKIELIDCLQEIANFSDYRAPGVSFINSWGNDNYRLFTHELFLYLIATLINYEDYGMIYYLTNERYHFRKRSANREFSGFRGFQELAESIEHRCQRLNMRLSMPLATLFRDRVAAPHVSFDDLMQADFVLFLISLLNSSRAESPLWFPHTLIYAIHASCFPIFKQATLRRKFDQIKAAFGVQSREEMQARYSLAIGWHSIRNGYYQIANMEYISIPELANFEKLDSQ